MLAFKHLNIHCVILLNSDLSAIFDFFLCVDDALCWYRIDGHDIQCHVSVLTPTQMATFLQLTARSNIKNRAAGISNPHYLDCLPCMWTPSHQELNLRDLHSTFMGLM